MDHVKVLFIIYLTNAQHVTGKIKNIAKQTILDINYINVLVEVPFYGRLK